MTNSDILVQVTESQHNPSDETEDNEDEQEGVNLEMLPPRKFEIRHAVEVFQSFCLFQSEGEEGKKYQRLRNYMKHLYRKRSSSLALMSSLPL